MRILYGYDLDKKEEILSDLQHLRNIRNDVVFKIIKIDSKLTTNAGIGLCQ